MVADAVLPSGKRRSTGTAESDPRRKIARIEKIPSRQTGYAFKLFLRIFKKEITKAEGFRCLTRRVPGLMIQGYNWEYQLWLKSKPQTEDNIERVNFDKEEKLSIVNEKALSKETELDEGLNQTFLDVISKKLSISQVAKKHSMRFTNMHRLLASFKVSLKTQSSPVKQRHLVTEPNSNEYVEDLKSIRGRLLNILEKGGGKEPEEKSILVELGEILQRF